MQCYVKANSRLEKLLKYFSFFNFPFSDLNASVFFKVGFIYVELKLGGGHSHSSLP